METRMLALVLGLLATAASHPAVLQNGCPFPAPQQGIIFLPHESNCNQYYTCEEGSRVLQACPSDQHFNLAQEACDLPDKAGCQVNPLPSQTAQQQLARQTVYPIYPAYPHHSVEEPIPVYPVYPEYPHHSVDYYPYYPEYPHHSVDYYPYYPEYPHHSVDYYPYYPEYPHHSIDYPVPVYPVYPEYHGYSKYSAQLKSDQQSAEMQAPPSRAYPGKQPTGAVNPSYPRQPPSGSVKPSYPRQPPAGPVKPSYPEKPPVAPVKPIYPGKPPVGTLPVNPVRPPVSPPRPTRASPPTAWNGSPRT